MTIDRDDHRSTASVGRATRCQLLLALLFLIGVSAIGWYLVARLTGA